MRVIHEEWNNEDDDGDEPVPESQLEAGNIAVFSGFVDHDIGVCSTAAQEHQSDDHDSQIDCAFLHSQLLPKYVVKERAILNNV